MVATPLCYLRLFSPSHRDLGCDNIYHPIML